MISRSSLRFLKPAVTNASSIAPVVLSILSFTKTQNRSRNSSLLRMPMFSKASGAMCDSIE